MPLIEPRRNEEAARFELGDNEMELGIGVHGEPGVKRVPMMKADDIVDTLLDKVLDDLKLESGENVLLYINGLGATPLCEQYIMYNHAHDVLTEKGINVTRSQIGNFFTSLEMSGASLTVMRLDDELTELCDAPVRRRAGAPVCDQGRRSRRRDGPGHGIRAPGPPVLARVRA